MNIFYYVKFSDSSNGDCVVLYVCAMAGNDLSYENQIFAVD